MRKAFKPVFLRLIALAAVAFANFHAYPQSATSPAVQAVDFTTTGTLNPGETHYFQIALPVNTPGWRVVLSATGTADPDVYVQRGAIPTVTTYLKQSVDRSLDTLFLDSTEATAGTYYVAVTIPRTDVGTANYKLSAELAPLTQLNWDAGLGAVPSSVYTNRSELGGDYFFKITAQSAASGIWRTRLDVQSGEANLYVRSSSLPTPLVSTVSSERTGSDGITLVQGPQYAANQVWYVMVTASPGAQWSLYSGALYVPPLPAPAADDSGSTNSVIAPEGMNFYRTTISSGTLAWRLGMGAVTNTLYVRQGAPAHSYSSSFYQWKQSAQLLLVPPYVKSGTEYFVTVTGTPGEAFSLESRQQPITDLPFGGSVDVVATNYGYQTFRVLAPAGQIGWQLELQVTSGDPAMSIREADVANDYISTAFSDATNAPLETITLVPPVLRNSAYYVTVYGKPPFAARLTNSQPVITDVSYAFSVTNDVPAKQGWRFYRVADINQQLSSLGWELLLNKQAPGTEIVLRRNAVPGQWASRSNFVQASTSTITRYLDGSSANGFLQRPRHTADVWYIGVKNIDQPLGAFVLSGREIPRPELPLTSARVAHRVSEQRAGFFQFFQIEVPPDALGLELNLANVTAGDPRLVVSRSMLPIDLRTILVNSNSWNPYSITNWPIGAQIAASTDWTGFTADSGGLNENGRYFFAGRGNPLETGTYYVGVLNNPGNTNEIGADLMVRALFPTDSFSDLPLVGVSSRANVAPHEAVWYRVAIPEGTPSWKFRLKMDSGDGFVVLRQNGLPNYGASTGSPTNLAGVKIRKTADEQYLVMPHEPAMSLPGGTYYLGVIGEGQLPSGTRAGSGTSSFTLTSQGAIPFKDLGTVDASGIGRLVSDEAQEGGEAAGFRFIVAPKTAVIEVRLRNRTGNPLMTLRADGQLPRLSDSYGFGGGWVPTGSDDDLIRIPTPAAGTYTLFVQAGPTGSTYSNATYTVEISAQVADVIGFDNALQSVSNQATNAWKYFAVNVPANALGWNVTLTNVTSGDPKMVICRDLVPFNLTSRSLTGSTWDPNLATNWPSGWQAAPDKDWAGYTTSASGTNENGRYFTASMGNPLEPGTYIIGVTSGGSPNSTNGLSYQLLSRGIGQGMALPVVPLNFASGQASGSGLAPHDLSFYRVEIPPNTPSWQLHLNLEVGDAMVVLRRGGLPNFGAAVTNAVTNVGGVKLQKAGNEHFVLLPATGSTEIPVGSYYIGVISEGVSAAAPRIGSNTCSFVVQSAGTLPVSPLGKIDSVQRFEVATNVVQAGGSVFAYTFEIEPGTVAAVVRLEERAGNPTMTLRGGEALPRTAEAYGRQGGWTEDFANSEIIRITNSVLGGRYTLLVHAATLTNQIPDAQYTLHIYSLVAGTIPLAFDGGEYRISGQAAGEWVYFSTTVPTNALGWDLRLRDVTSGSPRIVICRSSYPVNLNSQLANGSAWIWGAATNWPSGAQAAPGGDWTGYRFDPNSIDTTNTIFVAGLNSPLEPGNYVIGVSSPAASNAMTYMITSRGIGAGFKIPVQPLGLSDLSTTRSGLAPREAAYYSIDVPTNTPAWKLQLTPSLGDAMLVVRRGALPNVQAASNVLASLPGGGHKFQKEGNEQAVIGSAPGQTNLQPGLYYVAVVGEGAGASKGVIGTGATDYTLRSVLPGPISDLGSILPGGGDLVLTNQLEAGETALYRFSLPAGALRVSVGLEDATGLAAVRLRNDGLVPLDGAAYGQDGGFRGSWEHTNLVIVPTPAAGTYTLSILSTSSVTNFPGVSYKLRLEVAAPASSVAFDNGSARVTAQGSSWQVYTVVVPTNALGWDVRLINVTAGSPRLVISRGKAPVDMTSRDDLYGATNWPSGLQIAPGSDWSGLDEGDGSAAIGRVFQVGMGNPLEPGTYYIGVTNVNSSAPASYTLLSRGIGDGFSIPVIDVPFSDGTTSAILAAREAAWYRLNVPTDVAGWKVALNFDSGDGLLVAQRGTLPNMRADSTNSIVALKGGKKMRQLGDEHFLFLGTAARGTNIPSGTYYFGVISEGSNPDNTARRIGTGSAAYSLWSAGNLPPMDLGSVGPHDLLGQIALQGGESEVLTFSVAAGIPALQLSFRNATGSPAMTVAYGGYPPANPLIYGAEGGVTAQWPTTNVVTIPNPAATNFAVTVQAAGAGPDYPGAQFGLFVRSLPITTLSFDARLNSGTSSNLVTGVLEDGYTAYYRVQVPELLGGEPVVGWKLSLTALYGAPTMRVRRDILPENNGVGVSSFFARQAVFVPEYLTPGTWYVEVKASGLTGYTLTSESLALTRPAWEMPVLGGTVTTPGLPTNGAMFGDTGVAPNGTALPADRGVDLELDSFHYYAVHVPPGNGGLLRTELQAISGNPNLYLRRHAAPTLSHGPTGASGRISERALTNEIGSEFGNWAVLDGKNEFYLEPGNWYLAVHAAGGSHVRYRLQVSTGDVTDLPFTNGKLNGQALLAGDWRYYRVVLPVDMPDRWTISFSKQQGDIAVYVRDALPPGNGSKPSEVIDWNFDFRNYGPYPYFADAGSYTLSVPPLRPGQVYYLGVRALSDTVFSIGSTAGTTALRLNGVVSFQDGVINQVIPPGGSLLYRIDVPEVAEFWSHTSTHASSVRCYLSQGTLPSMTVADDWYSTGANSSLNALLVDSSWPWLAGFPYYLGVTNSSTISQPFSLRMQGAGSPVSSVAIEKASFTANGEIAFSLSGSSNGFKIQFSPTMAAGSWVDATNYTVRPDKSIVCPVPLDRAGFYRIVLP